MSIKTEQGTGPNAYTNETAGKEELQQGAYEIFVTPDGNEVSTDHHARTHYISTPCDSIEFAHRMYGPHAHP